MTGPHGPEIGGRDRGIARFEALLLAFADLARVGARDPLRRSQVAHAAALDPDCLVAEQFDRSPYHARRTAP